ncbi:MAG: hypothetical protein KAY65_10765 [Planctomycetes bacterium]|nr:hypothetical protein [Planctomycetota bacterium]
MMTLNSYNSLCDDFYVDMCINTELDLPTQRDTVLAFFERIQKQFPSMGRFYRRENNEYCLEEDRSLGQYRWVTLEIDRIASGVVNPSSFEMAYHQDRLVLELVPYMLSVSHLDIDSLDVTFTMDFDHTGSHDEVIADALFGSTAFNCLLDLPGARPIGFSPAIVVALSDDCHTQGRISIESKTSVYEPRKKEQSGDEAISLSFTVRRYPPTSGGFDPLESFDHQCRLAEEIMAEKIVPNFVQPLTETIAQKRLT